MARPPTPKEEKISIFFPKTQKTKALENPSQKRVCDNRQTVRSNSLTFLFPGVLNVPVVLHRVLRQKK